MKPDEFWKVELENELNDFLFDHMTSFEGGRNKIPQSHIDVQVQSLRGIPCEQRLHSFVVDLCSFMADAGVTKAFIEFT